MERITKKHGAGGLVRKNKMWQGERKKTIKPTLSGTIKRLREKLLG